MTSEFETCIDNNNVKHILTPLYHSQSNGAAERLVGNFNDKI